MKQVFVGFSKHNGFAPGSWLIRAFLREDFSHTYIRIKLNDMPSDSVFHAVGNGLTYISYDRLLAHNTVVKEVALDVTDDLYNELLSEFHNKAGLKYGYLQNLGQAIIKIFGAKTNPIDDGINCSEWVAYCIQEIDRNAFKNEDLNSISPKDVYNYFKQNGKIEN